MLPLEILTQPLSLRLGSTLLHFVWQGFLIAFIVWLALRFRGQGFAQQRYAISLAGLLLTTACPAVTFVALGFAETQQESPVGFAKFLGTSEDFNAATEQDDSDSPSLTADFAPVEETPHAAIALPAQFSLSVLPPLRPYLVLVWLCGVLLFSVRLLLGYAGTHWLRRGGCEIDAESQARFDRLAWRLGLSRARVWVSSRVSEALVVGFWRPLVLIPAAWLAELPPATLEAIVAHELAHLRRYDLWVNLLQRIVETLLFYHPAVWWLSGRLRVERELCCDELAVAVTGRRVEYVTALELVARKRLVSPRPLLAAPIGGENEMTLLNRVRNILGISPKPDRARLWPVGLLLLAAPLALWAASTGLLSSGQPQASADDERADKKEGERREEVRKEGEKKEGERKVEVRREGDRPAAGKEGERREEVRKVEVKREGDRPVERKADAPREADRPAAPRAVAGAEGDLIRLIQQLRDEVNALRAEVRELRAKGGGEIRRDVEIRRDADRPKVEGERPGADRPKPDAVRRDGDRPKEGEIRRDGDRPKEGEIRRDGDRQKEGEIRRDGDRPRADGERPGADRPKADVPRRDGDREKPKTSGVIKAIAEEGKLVEITLGEGQAVKAGQFLAVVRADKYLGRVLVVKVTDNRAVGEVSLAGKDVKFEAGDLVIANLEGSGEAPR